MFFKLCQPEKFSSSFSKKKIHRFASALDKFPSLSMKAPVKMGAQITQQQQQKEEKKLQKLIKTFFSPLLLSVVVRRRIFAFRSLLGGGEISCWDRPNNLLANWLKKERRGRSWILLKGGGSRGYHNCAGYLKKKGHERCLSGHERCLSGCDYAFFQWSCRKSHVATPKMDKVRVNFAVFTGDAIRHFIQVGAPCTGASCWQ